MSDDITNEKLEEMMQQADLSNDKEMAEKLIEMHDKGDLRIPDDFIYEMKERFGKADTSLETTEEDPEKSPSETESVSIKDISYSSDKELIVTQHKNWKAGEYKKKLVSDLLLAEDDPYALWQVARLYHDSDSLEKAISAYESAYRIFKSSLVNPEVTADVFDLMIELAEAYSATGQTDKATAIYENAMEIIPDNPTAEDIAKLLMLFDKYLDITSDKKKQVIKIVEKQILAGNSSFPISFRIMLDEWASNDMIIAIAIGEIIQKKAEEPEEKACADLALSVFERKEISIKEDITGPFYKIIRLLLMQDDHLQIDEIEEAAIQTAELSGGIVGTNWQLLSDKINELRQKAENEKLAQEKEKQEKEKEKQAAEQLKIKEKAEKEEKRRKKTQAKKASIIGSAIVLLIVLVSVIANRPTKIDPFNYITISPMGVNGFGYIESSVNYDLMSADLGQTVTEDNLVIDYSPESNLKNGDTLEIKVSEKGLTKVKFTKNAEEISIENLPEGKPVDAFKDLDVSFYGIDGSGIVKLTNKSNDPLLKAAKYDCGTNDGSLKNGDAVTITVSASNENIFKYLESPQETSKIFTVEGLGTYASTISDINDDSFNKLVTDEQEILTAKIQSDHHSIYYIFGGDDKYYDVSNFNSLEFKTAYLASGNNGNRLSIEANNTDSETNNTITAPFNRLMLVYRITATPDYLFDRTPKTAYVKILVNNVIVANGNILNYTKEYINFDEGISYYSQNYYVTKDDLYNAYIAQYKVTGGNSVTQR